MLFRHTGLTCSSEEKSDKFYHHLLGLNKSEPKILPSELSKAIFNFDDELQIISYLDDKVHFEIFITPPYKSNHSKIEHACLEVDNLSFFLEKCRTMNVEIKQIPKGDKTVTFIKDYDGNLFEIKGK